MGSPHERDHTSRSRVGLRVAMASFVRERQTKNQIGNGVAAPPLPLLLMLLMLMLGSKDQEARPSLSRQNTLVYVHRSQTNEATATPKALCPRRVGIVSLV